MDFELEVCSTPRQKLSDEDLLQMWRGMGTPEGWTMNDLIVMFGRLVEATK